METSNSPVSNMTSPTSAKTDPDSIVLTTCRDIDQVKGWSLSETWTRCIRFHDDNQMMRNNLKEMENILQLEIHQWSTVRDMILKDVTRIREVQAKSGVLEADLLKMELEMTERLAKTLSRLNACVNDIRKEIRASEFQSQFFFHVNQVQGLMTGLTAIIAQHFQESPNYAPAIKAIQGLARTKLMRPIEAEAKEIKDELDRYPQ